MDGTTPPAAFALSIHGVIAKALAAPGTSLIVVSVDDAGSVRLTHEPTAHRLVAAARGLLVQASDMLDGSNGAPVAPCGSLDRLYEDVQSALQSLPDPDNDNGEG